MVHFLEIIRVVSTGLFSVSYLHFSTLCKQTDKGKQDTHTSNMIPCKSPLVQFPPSCKTVRLIGVGVAVCSDGSWRGLNPVSSCFEFVESHSQLRPGMRVRRWVRRSSFIVGEINIV
jgi:hypothetical protein